MENINKLTFITYKYNESVLNIPMDEIKQEFDSYTYTKKYLFKVLYVAKQLKDGNYIIFLGPLENSNLPIIKATIPFEIIRTDKIIPNYAYDRELEKQERYIVDERVYKRINILNRKAHRGYSNCYVLAYGYLVNSYKDNDALTTLKEGIQEFRISTISDGYFSITSTKSTNCLVTNRWEKICSALQKEYPLPKFKKLPDGFFVEWL